MDPLKPTLFVAFIWFFVFSFSFCLNREGLALLKFKDRVVIDPFGALSDWVEDNGVADPCSWSGVRCWDEKVVALDLRDLCLVGTLAPEIRDLGYLKFIFLRNNSFNGEIPGEILDMKELEVLDLGYNNFTGIFLSDFANEISLTTLLLDNNKFLDRIPHELNKLKLVSESLMDKNLLADAPVRPSCNSYGGFLWNEAQPRKTAERRLQQRFPSPSAFPRSHVSAPPAMSPNSLFSAPPSPLGTPSVSPSPSLQSSVPSPPPSHATKPNPALPAPVLRDQPPKSSRNPKSFSTSPLDQTSHKKSSSKHHKVLLFAGIIGGISLLLVSVICVVFFRSTKVVTVKPWRTGLSGQLQKAFVTGVPNLKRSELEAACEDFSNIIGSFSGGTLYKGTLSSGVEIAVTSFIITTRKAWSEELELSFRNKIEELSKVNHKNFVNLIGYCEEDEPFTRMMVFEYASNGTLSEHLHVQGAEHLNWETRVRIAVGMAYCLEHMHQLDPAIPHRKLHSSSVYLTEDYAAKIADFCFWSNDSNNKIGSGAQMLIENPLPGLESNIYSFGLILMEMMTGRKSDLLADCLTARRQPVKDLVDPSLRTFNESEFEKLFEVINSCVHPDPRERPTMREITMKLKEITAMGPDGATPKHSPLWWAELQILSEAD